jgi:hypothetical protein
MESERAFNVWVAAATMAVEAATPDLLSALRDDGIDVVVMKGATFAVWLYDDPRERPFSDIDLLLRSDDFAAAERVLTRLGYRGPLETEILPSGRPMKTRTWQRDRDGVQVELHDTLIGIEVAPAAAWATLRRESEDAEFGPTTAPILNERARTLHVALHVARHGAVAGKPVEDLRRAVARVPLAVWQDAAALAEELDAVPAFVAGLRLTPEGAALAESLAVDGAPSAETALRAGSTRATHSSVERALVVNAFSQVKGIRAKARFAAREAFPQPAALRARSRLAKRGSAGLAAAYVWRFWRVVALTPPAAVRWVHARRETTAGRR